MRKTLSVLIALATCLYASAQAGKGVYQILDLPMDARSIGLGGTNVSLFDGDLNLATNNPALLSDKAHNMLTLNYAKYIAGINYGSAAYGRTWGENNFALAVNYIDFGTFGQYNELDVYQGTFTAKDMVLGLLYSRQFGKYFSVGATLKTIYSAYERYSSMGMAVDFGANYHDEDNMLDLGLTVRNIGFQFDGYYSIDGTNHRQYTGRYLQEAAERSAPLLADATQFAAVCPQLRAYLRHRQRVQKGARHKMVRYDVPTRYLRHRDIAKRQLLPVGGFQLPTPCRDGHTDIQVDSGLLVRGGRTGERFPCVDGFGTVSERQPDATLHRIGRPQRIRGKVSLLQ